MLEDFSCSKVTLALHGQDRLLDWLAYRNFAALDKLEVLVFVVPVELLDDRLHKLAAVRLLHCLPKVHHVSTHLRQESH